MDGSLPKPFPARSASQSRPALTPRVRQSSDMHNHADRPPTPERRVAIPRVETRSITLKASSIHTVDTIKRGTKNLKKKRLPLVFLTIFALLLALIFSTLVQIGCLSPKKLIGDWYFLELDLRYLHVSDLPDWVSNMPVNRLVGLHDFYRVGLWSYCAGLSEYGVVYCSKPIADFWFNPVRVLESELLIGSSSKCFPLLLVLGVDQKERNTWNHYMPTLILVTLPADINETLGILKTCSRIMFGFFEGALYLTLVTMVVTPFGIVSRRGTIAITALSFLSALCSLVATTLATILFILFRRAIMNAGRDMNIKARVGTTMFAFMWTETAFTLLAWCTQAGLLFCVTGNTCTAQGKRNGEKAPSLNKVETEDTDSGANNAQEPCYTSGRFGRLSRNF